MKRGFWRGLLTGSVIGSVVGAVLAPIMSPEARGFWRRNRNLVRRMGRMAWRFQRRVGRRVRVR